MNNILASVPINQNQKPPNRNGNDPVKITPIVIKPNQKSNFNQAKMTQPVNIPYNTNSIGAVSVHNTNPPSVQTISHKNAPSQISKINQSPPSQMQFQQPQQIQKIAQPQQTQYSQAQQAPIVLPQDPTYFQQQQQISQQPQQPPKPPEPPTPDEKIYNFLLTKYRKSFLLLLANSSAAKPENSNIKSRQLSKNSKINESNSRHSANLQEVNDNSLNENDQYFSEPKRIPGRQGVRSPIDPSLLEKYFFDISHEEAKISREGRSSRRQVAAPFCPQYEKWKKVGHGYLVNPNPPYMFEEPHFVDFICQCKLKALAIGGEGNSSYGSKDEQAPILASNARLQLSMMVDELGIEHLKVEKQIKEASSKNPKPGTIDKLAKYCNSLETKIREYNDDFRNKYRKPPSIPYDLNKLILSQQNSEEDNQNSVDYYIPPDNCKFPLEQLHFFLYALRMIELASLLTPKHSLHITKALTLVLPLILKAVTRPEKEWHFIGKKVHYTYFYRLFHLLNRLTEYFSQLPMIPCHASFGIINGIRSDITVSWQKELHKISDNIIYGGCLSWLLCEMRDISLALTIHLNDVIMIKETIQLYDDYEHHHVDRFPHSTNYMHSYFNNNNTSNSTKNNFGNESFLRNRSPKSSKQSPQNDNNNNAGKKMSLKKSSKAHLIYDNDNVTGTAFSNKIDFDEDDKYDFGVDDLLNIACRENNDQRLYMIRFVLDDDGMLSFVAREPDQKDVLKASILFNCQTHVPPLYPFILAQHKQKNEDEIPVYIPEDKSFRFDVAVPSTEKFGKPPGKIHFEPFSQQSMFSLNISNFY